MFPKNSAFHKSEERLEHEARLRDEAWQPSPPPADDAFSKLAKRVEELEAELHELKDELGRRHNE
jgi:cell division protein FtsB